eukprot:Transcript_7673.p4 GENE.Transcript_7673~~Transcript_7673.p4  ORF type:complete len:109 (+),score=12.42 Transcript_7673:121-447(+)
MAERRLTKLQQAAREVSDLQEAVSDAIARDEHLELATWRICVVTAAPRPVTATKAWQPGTTGLRRGSHGSHRRRSRRPGAHPPPPPPPPPPPRPRVSRSQPAQEPCCR